MSKTKILIIDDSKDILEGMRMFLELKKYVVFTLSDAKNTFATIAEFNPDVVILDIYLSGTDGRLLCRKLKTSDETRHLKIILFSAATNALHDFQSYGADACLEKPFGLEEIFQKIEAVLRN